MQEETIKRKKEMRQIGDREKDQEEENEKKKEVEKGKMSVHMFEE